jgi:hypothetical protein
VTGRTTVDAFGATYLLPRAHPSPDGARLRLDAVARRLDRALARPLTELERERDGEVWLFRRVDVDVELDLAADDDALARRWAAGIADAIARRLGSGAPGSEPDAVPAGDGDVVRFADPADQLAELVAGLAAGTAWSRWWNAPFAGLRELPTAAAIHAALARDPPRARAALARLAQREPLHAVADALGERGCARTVTLLYDDVPAPPDGAETVARSARRALERGLAGAAAVLLVCAESGRGAAPRIAGSEERGGSVAEHALRAVAVAVAEQERSAATTPSGRARAASRATAVQAPMWTPFGGAFLLLRGLVELGLEHAGAEERLLALRSALGPEHAEATAADAVLAAVAGVVAEDDPGSFGLDLGAQLVRLGRADGMRLAAEPTAYGTLLVDLDRDVWLALGDDEAVRAPAGATLVADAGLAGVVARTELESFVLPDAPPAAAVAGRAVLQELARRLHGFERSTPQHLRRNVLERPANVHPHAAGVRVELAPAPLDVLLRLAGLERDRFDVPWLGEVELVLEP